MFALAFFIGIYSYCIFILGLLGLLYSQNIVYLSIIYFGFMTLYFRKEILNSLHYLRKSLYSSLKQQNSFILLLFILLLIQGIINLIGAFGPETGFDALWYHLTLPKLYLQAHKIYFIPGGLLYYSVMPKLIEMVYILPLSFWNETGVKLIHFLFGVLSMLAIFIFSKEYVPKKYALLACSIFYANLVVGWESTSAYIDLGRAFFEIMGLWGLLLWLKTNKTQWLVESAIMIGFAITVKLLAISSLFIFLFLLLLILRHKNYKMIKRLQLLLTFIFFSLIVPFPWLIFSYIQTGNPVYPFFTNIYPVHPSTLTQPILLIKDFFVLFTSSADPINPIYIMVIPLVILLYKRFTYESKIILYYCIFALLFWYLTPRTGGGRFLVSYLPAFSILVGIYLYTLGKNKTYVSLSKILIGLVVTLSCISIGYRALANFRYIPVIFRMQSKQVFLEKNLNFGFGDFYDTDNFFNTTITSSDKVLLYGFHNLYYVNFPYIDSTWVRKGDEFSYIATQNTPIPNRFRYWQKVHYNPKTDVSVYKLGETRWVY